MAKSMVEKYEQILARDPASAAFVELAKALIEKGDHQRAVDVCQGGLVHHANSVVGRVLWGKALINLGRPAEAMEQFDRAIAIDRENAHAYNLIGEALLHKGLYRSALPLLKKAVSLQPNDGRIRQWYEQTKQALAGGPAPVLHDLTSLDAEPAKTDPGVAVEGAAKTDVNAVPPSDDPFSTVPDREDSADVVPGLTSVFDSLQPSADAPFPQEPIPPEPRSEPTIIAAAELFQPLPVLKPQGGLLDDLPPPPQTSESVVSQVSVAPQRPAGQKAAPSLLGDLPDADKESMDLPKPQVSHKATQAIAQEYERELRAKMAEQASQKTFLQRYGLWLGLAVVLLAVSGVGIGAWRSALAKHHGLGLKDALAQAKIGITQDTGVSYRNALASLREAQAMDDSVPEVWALTAYANALLFAEHGQKPEDKAASLSALGHPGVDAQYGGLKVVIDYYLAEPAQRPAAAKAVLDATVDQSEIQELAGRLLLAHKEVKAGLDRLSRATQEAPSDVRALMALGDYYRDSGDFAAALDAYGRGLRVSPQHPGAAAGHAEAALELGQDLAEPLKSLGDIAVADDWAPGAAARFELVRGRVLSAAGHGPEAIALLTEGAKKYRSETFAFQMALAEACRNAGQMAEAQRAVETALAQGKREEAKEALGRILIARDRAKDVLTRLPPESDSRRVSLVRGMAFARLGEWKRARQELAHTQSGGKYPPEAVIALALADAADGDAERAQQVLEKILGASKKAKVDVRVALGKLYWDRGILDKARAQFEEAAKEQTDYEGGCSLGRLLLQLGLHDVAQKPLTLSVEHNPSHQEARHALGQVLLMLGKPDEALKVFQAGVDDNPTSPAALRDLAWGLWAMGRFNDADAAVTKSLRGDATDPVAYRVQAQVLFALLAPKDGFKALERANKLNPKDPDTFCEIGRAFLRQGNSDMAGKAFEAAKRERETAGCAAVGTRLAALPSGGKAAEKELSEIANAGSAPVPDRVFAQSTLARLWLSAGKLKEARKVAEEAVGLSPRSGDAYLALGLVAQKQHDFAKAKEALALAAALEPSHALVELGLGDVLARGGEADAAGAVSAYEAFLRTGGMLDEEPRVRRQLTALKKKVASR